MFSCSYGKRFYVEHTGGSKENIDAKSFKETIGKKISFSFKIKAGAESNANISL